MKTSGKDLAAGVEYAIRPVNTSDVYVWNVKSGVMLPKRSAP